MGVNPARAGMIPCCRLGIRSCSRKPRASGDDPTVFSAVNDAEP